MRTHYSLLAVLFIATLAPACTSSVSEGGGGGPPDGGQPPDGGCITPTVSDSCSPGDVACQPPDPCCAGYEWTCEAGAWVQAGLGCACKVPGPFACGSTMCATGSLCEDHPPGNPPDGGVPQDTHSCSPVPASCASTPTCACIEATLPPDDLCSTQTLGVTCIEDGDGNVTLHCFGE